MKRINYLIIPLMLVFGACTKKSVESYDEKQIIVKTAEATLKTYNPELCYSGSITAGKEANLGVVLPGKVEKLFVREGSNVTQGQLLAQLSDELLTQAQIEFNAIKKDYDRIAELFKKGSISEMEHDHLKAKLEASEEKYNMLKKNTQIRAPFAGIVTEILVKEGENFMLMPALNPGYSHSSGIIRLMQLDQVKVQVSINEKDISQIKKGLLANVTCDAYPNETFRGQVDNVHPILSNFSRTTTVDIIINNKDKKLLPGMFCRASIELPIAEGIFIPRYAMLKQSGTNESYVFVYENGVAAKKIINIVKSVDDEIIVTGINTGEQVITAGKTKVQDGDILTIDRSEK